MLDSLAAFLAKRPAESATSTASIIAAALLAVFHVKDAALLAPLALVLGHVPAAVTWLVTLWRRPKGTRPVAG